MLTITLLMKSQSVRDLSPQTGRNRQFSDAKQTVAI